MLFNLDYVKVFWNMANKFEKLLQCESVIILRCKDEKLEWLNNFTEKQKKLKLNLKDKLLYECFSENQSFVINEPDKDIMFHPKIGKQFDI
jgi:hypothetical protein